LPVLTLSLRPVGVGDEAAAMSGLSRDLSPPPRLLNPRNLNLRHPHHRVEHPPRRLAVRAGQRIDQRARRDLPVQAPLVLAPAAGAGLAAVVDEGVPQAVGFGLVVGGDLEGEGLGVRKDRPAVQADAGDAGDGEFDRQHVALLAHRVVGGRVEHGADGAVREGGGVELRGFERGAVEPEADGVLGGHERAPFGGGCGGRGRCAGLCMQKPEHHSSLRPD
jgi:hypothetical protein